MIPERVRSIQLILLDIAKDIDRVCRKHQIPYLLASGNLLGAVRHGGFIPWDDDLDIYFFPDDLIRFKKVFKEEMKEKKYYFFYNDFRPSNYGEYLADGRYVWDFFYPVKVDLLQMKSLPNTPEALKEDFERVRMLGFLYNKNRGEDFSVTSYSFAKRILKDGSCWNRRERYMDEFHQYVLSHSAKTEGNLYHFDYTDTFLPRLKQTYRPEDYFQYNTLFPLGEIQFECYQFMAPNDVHGFLIRNYGENYMTPPPVEKQKWEHQSLRKALIPSTTKWNVALLYRLKQLKNTFTVYFKTRKLKIN
jgi:lipopolysaccharide cholinephosphotransferase